MEKISVLDARNPDAVGRQATLQGWVRTRRDSKGGFSFLELNDGSCLANIQVVVDGDLPNYEAEVKRLSAGCSVTIHGEIKPSQGKGQTTEVQAAEVIVHGWADPEEYPLQKKRHSFEKLREWAHFSAIALMVSACSITSATSSGIRSSSAAISRPFWRDIRRVRANFNAIISNTATWQVKALVEATPISGPACK